MDNLTNTILLIERIEQVPRNDIQMYRMNWFKIRSLMTNPGPDTCVYTNGEMIKFVENKPSFSWFKNFYYNQKIIPSDAINYILINHCEANIYYGIVLLEIHVDKLPKEFYTLNNTESDIMNKVNIEYLNCVMSSHFEIINNINNKSCENEAVSNTISKSSKDYFKSKAIDQPEFIKTPLYLYQKVNVHWMSMREKEPLPIELSEDKVINWGPKLEINVTKNQVIDKLKYKWNKESLNYLVGGCLCDDVGLGKTLQILTLALMEPSTTLIIVPAHLVTHWVDEYNKHVDTNWDSKLVVCDGKTIESDIAQYNESTTRLIVLGTFVHLKAGLFTKFKFNRVVVDEFHEIVNEKANNLDKLHANFKWVVTATPFVNSQMINNILNWIGKYPIQYQQITKYKKYINTFSEMFRKNTKQNVEKEIGLPQIKEIKYYLTFSQKERLYYDSICNSSDANKMRKNFCINPNLYFKSDDAVDSFVSIDALDDTIKAHHQKEYDTQYKKILDFKMNLLIPVVESIKKMELDEKSKNQIFNELAGSLLSNPTGEIIENIWNLMITNDSYRVLIAGGLITCMSMEKTLSEIKSKITYFNSQLELINKTKQTDETETHECDDTDCGICLGSLDSQFTILHCGHMFCYECIKLLSQSTLTKCPMCKTGIVNTTNYLVGVDAKPTDYGTKISRLIKICKEKKNKIILFSHTKALLNNLSSILAKSNIKAKLFNQDEPNTFESDDTQVLILSSESNASGLNFQYVQTVILLEPLEGEYIYRKQIENQIIGRLHRIGQTKPIEFIRFIISDSIETDIDKANKISDAIYADTNSEYSLPVIQTEIVV